MSDLLEVENIRVPVIDLREFEDSSASEAYKKLREACEELGCFRIINHGISPRLMAEMKEVVRCIFDHPVEIKRRNFDISYDIGYLASSEVNPLYEALGLYDIGSPEALYTFCDQLETLPHQREIIEKYVGKVQELCMDMGRKLAKSMGLDNSDFCNGWQCQFRLNKYNFTSELVDSSGMQIHTDYGFLTILQDDENVGGLEVMNRSGEFLPVDSLPGSFLLNIGDSAKVWSNGRFRNVKHRVQCKDRSIRVSIAIFLLGPKKEAIEAPQELVNDEHPRLYVPFSYDDYRKLRLSTNLHAGEALELWRAPISSNST